ncbi:zinc transport protein [Raphidocelis subcapitata]|uniref:Zinc transport protein n=1 Tax=Raphidocelis subcapitata TaxID=307507 RepID=A0A2V0NUK6_9CHLO|nr:zinc transport protein [Raphidocelis subcapitata]|eukprot:GBF88617.1 zinc transport protein [Raphidocelis subcapitata]
MERFTFDLVSAVVLLATALIGAFLPKHLESHGSGQPNSAAALAFHLGNCLSAGVMLSAGFCHLLADSLRQLSFIGHFPIATFLAASGYLLTLTADQLVQGLMDRADGGGDAAGGGAAYRPLTHASPPAASPNGSPQGSPVSAGVLRDRGRALEQQQQQLSQQQHGLGLGHLQRLHGGDDTKSPGDDGGLHEIPLVASGGGAPPPSRPLSRSPRRGAPASPLKAPPGRGFGGGGGGGGHAHLREASFEHVLELEAAVGAHNHFQALLSNRRLSFATALLLAGALCVHSLLEGMALGAQPTLRGTEDIFLAIVAHKGLAAYALGASIVESRASDAKFWTTIGLFAAATPVGIFLGYGFAAHSGGVGAAVSALAAGTFIYVALMEVVPKELEDGRHRAAKMASMLVGFGLMSLLAVWA